MKYVRSCIVFCFSILVMCIMLGCSQLAESPSQVVSKEIDNIKGGNRDLYKNMFLNGIVDINFEESEKELFKNSSVKIDRALSDITYTINSEKIFGDEAVVNVTLTGPELDLVWSKLVNCVKSDISSGAIGITNLNLEIIVDRYDKIISDFLDNNMKTSTRSMDIKLKKDNGQWKISDSDNIVKLTINVHPDNVKHILNHI